MIKLIYSDWICSDNKTRRHMRRLIVDFLCLRWYSSWRVSSVLLTSLSTHNYVVRAKEIIIFRNKSWWIKNFLIEFDQTIKTRGQTSECLFSLFKMTFNLKGSVDQKFSFIVKIYKKIIFRQKFLKHLHFLIQLNHPIKTRCNTTHLIFYFLHLKNTFLMKSFICFTDFFIYKQFSCHEFIKNLFSKQILIRLTISNSMWSDN